MLLSKNLRIHAPGFDYSPCSGQLSIPGFRDRGQPILMGCPGCRTRVAPHCWLVDQRGFEPLTLGLQSRCSTTELLAPFLPCRQVTNGRVVRRGGLEPPTSRLSGVCSNQLSYRRPTYSPGVSTSLACLAAIAANDPYGHLCLALAIDERCCKRPRVSNPAASCTRMLNSQNVRICLTTMRIVAHRSLCNP